MNATTADLLNSSFLASALRDGDRVNGEARLGDVVVYADAANVPEIALVVVGLPEVTAQGFRTDYRLESVLGGPVKTSDLRQAGWTFGYRAV